MRQPWCRSLKFPFDDDLARFVYANVCKGKKIKIEFRIAFRKYKDESLLAATKVLCWLRAWGQSQKENNKNDENQDKSNVCACNMQLFMLFFQIIWTEILKRGRIVEMTKEMIPESRSNGDTWASLSSVSVGLSVNGSDYDRKEDQVILIANVILHRESTWAFP